MSVERLGDVCGPQSSPKHTVQVFCERSKRFYARRDRGDLGPSGITAMCFISRLSEGFRVFDGDRDRPKSLGGRWC
ncbi:hypothetical protein FRC08_004495 [Ceratobasidium sp. 394]|nr:hypothetical protein FRC08_004495 [Ceratobasidium sp. 394]